MADTLLKVDNINVYYGNIHAVKDISFEVDQGEIVTLIGANGAGKSTTLKTISGLLKPKTGDILYKGSSIKGMRAHKIVEAGLAHVPEGRHVFLHMTVEENLDMGAYTQPASTIAPNKEKVFELFPRLKERRKQLAIEDDESMLYFPEDIGSREQRRLHAAFNRIHMLMTENRRKAFDRELHCKEYESCATSAGKTRDLHPRWAPKGRPSGRPYGKYYCKYRTGKQSPIRILRKKSHGSRESKPCRRRP